MYTGLCCIYVEFDLSYLSYAYCITVHIQQGSLQWRRELAALIIQLAWRQYLRRKLLRQSLRRQRVLHDWTPSVLAARQRALVEKIYGESQTITTLQVLFLMI